VQSTRLLCLGLAAGLFILVGQPAVAQSARSKVDRSVQDSLRTGAATQHIIITIDDVTHERDSWVPQESARRRHRSERPMVGRSPPGPTRTSRCCQISGVHGVANARVNADGA
jgi:hypothetical protein